MTINELLAVLVLITVWLMSAMVIPSMLIMVIVSLVLFTFCLLIIVGSVDK